VDDHIVDYVSERWPPAPAGHAIAENQTRDLVVEALDGLLADQYTFLERQ
jgi:hypothetical protein